MRCIVYISFESRRLTKADLHKILAAARRKNAEMRVTGVLLHFDGLFLQVLEGTDEVIAVLLRTIRNDKRHQDLRILLDEPITARHFPDWAMALADLADLPAEDRWLCRNLDRPLPELQSEEFAERIRRLIGSFQAMVNAGGEGDSQ